MTAVELVARDTRTGLPLDLSDGARVIEHILFFYVFGLGYRRLDGETCTPCPRRIGSDRGKGTKEKSFADSVVPPLSIANRKTRIFLIARIFNPFFIQTHVR